MTELLVEPGLADQTNGIPESRPGLAALSPPDKEIGSFAEEMLPHLDAAYNLARWLLRNGPDAEDVVHEAYIRALRYFGGFRGGDRRAWLLKIVRHTAYEWLQKNQALQLATEFDESIHSGPSAGNPETLMLQNADAQLVERALRALPVRFREMLVLRELEGLTYKEIADVVGVPIGTVMSTLSRARERFRHAFNEEVGASLRSPTEAPVSGSASSL
jgi:RNA polymerase sigma-70 factor (ECF subfamily)